MATARKTQFPPKADTRTATAESRPGGKAPAHEKIAARAQEIWRERGCPKGQDEEIWYQAERELRAGSPR